jgi:hypothetical protein
MNKIEVGSWVKCFNPQDKNKKWFIGKVTNMNGLYTGTIHVDCFKYTGVYLKDCILASDYEIENRKEINLFGYPD